MTDAVANYHSRMRRVIDHIDANLDGDLDVGTLCAVAAFSPHHFHRQFTASFGVPVGRYVQLARMRRASAQLAFRQGSVTEVALDAGYAAPDGFARAFRERFGQPPSAFRAAPDWRRMHATLAPLHAARRQLGEAAPPAVSIVTHDATPVAVLEHRGDPATIGDTIRRFIGWRRANGLHPSRSATFNIFHCDPRTTPPADYRLDLCAATQAPIGPNAEGVRQGRIAGGRCASVRVTGGGDALEAAALHLYRDWLPASGEAPGDPLFCRRLRFFPDVPEHAAVSDLFLPLVG